MIAGQPIGDLLLRVAALEDLRAIAEIAVITHDLDEYCKVDLYEYANGAGMGGAGVQGAGGTALTSSPATYDLYEKHMVVVRAREAFGAVADVVQWQPTRFIVNFAQLDKSILVVLTPHKDSLPLDVLARIQLLEQTLFNNFQTNHSQILFDDIRGLEVSGNFDSDRQRLEV
jgi:hypothetical protein